MMRGLLLLVLVAGCSGAASTSSTAPAREDRVVGVRTVDPPSGSLSLEVIHREVQSESDRFRACWLAHRPDPGARGRVMVRFEIGGDGTVASAAIHERMTDIEQTALHACILDVVRSLRFPEPGAPAHVSFPFVFGPESE